MENRFPGGSWPVMLTPFTEDNKIDYDGLKELVDWYIKNESKIRSQNCGVCGRKSSGHCIRTCIRQD